MHVNTLKLIKFVLQAIPIYHQAVNNIWRKLKLLDCKPEINVSYEQHWNPGTKKENELQWLLYKLGNSL